MAEQGAHKINSLKQRYIGYQILADVVLSLAIALLLLAIANYRAAVSPWWGLLAFVVILIVLLFIHKPWQITPISVTTFLNQHYPELEESAELSLKREGELSLLQRLQLAKVESALTTIPATPRPFIRKAKDAGRILLISLVISAFIPRIRTTIFADPIPPLSELNSKAEKVLPQISELKLTIHPPAYTGKAAREQDKFTILAEEGSTAQWHISTTIAVKQMSLLFNDHDRIALIPGADKTSWTAQRSIDKPGFYQVIIDGKASDLYQIETIKDNAPQIHIKTPKQYIYIDAGEKPLVNLTTTVTDDYGVSNALIYATVAKGSGEGVKFKEYQIPFGQSFQSHSAQYSLQHLFDLPKLNMEPGDELYFYIEAQDNHQQKSRTDVYTVSIQDTAALLSMDGIVNGSNLKPEYFRSQRQIIMDTEKLLKSRDTLGRDKFNSMCGDIGADQKMLRLRYGKFLGEEEESNVGGMGENAELSKAENFSNAAMILDAMTDKHDNAEDATYFEPAIKAQLKATLTEMWNAELHLRMYKPQEALPFEYKALRLLKDLQQKSRAYVAKTAYKPTPLKMEKRLSGDLSKINQPLNQQEIKPGSDAYETLKNAVQLLEQIKLTRTYSDADKHLLQLAKQQLSLKASAQPGVYLTAVSAMNRIISNTQPNMQDIDLVERAIQRTLPQTAQMPQSKSIAPDMGLSQHYFQNLKRRQ
ncbi:hypothetical protein [Mucilaginibacter boryungensis]|uniref:DUF4175 domain-containing protein n=1 Tax=Mucilaginibacter boryungensis TaxID=768480 RepID=A0ABR9XIP8_9SPHI|nr:hypothetical protein [Mucilaginibacter boryungensis]MBE9667065.1 hypothetical protein [Mucilaginibacter boryungensis]